MTVERIPTPTVRMTVSGPVRKLCPVKDEVDIGHVTISYDTKGEAFELHSLAAFLKTFGGRHLSHESFTFQVARKLDADVTTTWTTAGMEVTCAVLRQPDRPSA